MLEPADAREARVALGVIDERTREEMARRHRAIAAIIGGGEVTATCCDVAHLTSEDLELAVASWRDAVPPGASARAELIHFLAERAGLSLEHRAVTVALGIGDGAVERAFESRYGVDVTTFISRFPVATVRRELDGVSTAPEHWVRFERSFEKVSLSAGERLDPPQHSDDSIYVVLSGCLREVADGAPAPRELRPWDVIGAVSALANRPPSGSVVAVGQSELFRVGSQHLERFLHENPAAMRRMLGTISRQLFASQDAMAAKRRPLRRIAVVPAGATSPNDVRRFVERFSSFLGRHTNAAMMTEERVAGLVGEAESGRDEPWTSTSRAARLERLERTLDLVLYLALPASPGNPAGAEQRHTWEHWCVRHADVVLLVAGADADATSNEMERFLACQDGEGSPVRRELVILHESSKSPPGGSKRWRAGRRLDRTHLVVPSDHDHLGRLARFLVERPVGLVLSGGALRGFAHVGVLRALHEHGVPVDAICGTSVGALVGAQYAMGLGHEALEQASTALLAGGRRRFVDITIPTTSLFGGVRFNRVLEEVFGDQQFEDLWLPLLCTVSDLTAAELVVRDTGLVRHAVRASASLPPFLPPVVSDGHLLADGGIINNLPVTPLLSRIPTGTLIAVNAGMPVYRADEAYNYVDSLPFAKVLNGRLNPLTKRLVAPGIVRVFLRAGEMGSQSREAEEIDKADLYVRPRFESAFATDMTRLPSIIRRGYEAATAALVGWDHADVPFV